MGRRQKAGKKVSKINAEMAMNVDVSKMLPHLGRYVMQISTTVSLNDQSTTFILFTLNTFFNNNI
jgi:hypothetical protein